MEGPLVHTQTGLNCVSCSPNSAHHSYHHHLFFFCNPGYHLICGCFPPACQLGCKYPTFQQKPEASQPHRSSSLSCPSDGSGGPGCSQWRPHHRQTFSSKHELMNATVGFVGISNDSMCGQSCKETLPPCHGSASAKNNDYK